LNFAALPPLDLGLKNSTGRSGSGVRASGTRSTNAALVAAIAANAPVPTKTNSSKPESSTTIITAASTRAAAEPSPATREMPRRSRPYQTASAAPISNAARIRPRGKFATTA
jgi:hypothetical protein